jgi:hypothetical protein
MHLRQLRHNPRKPQDSAPTAAHPKTHTQPSAPTAENNCLLHKPSYFFYFVATNM